MSVTTMATTDNDIFNNVTNMINERSRNFVIIETNEDKIGRWIQIIFGGVIIIVGTIGNSISLLILRSGDLKKLSTCFYMTMLAVFDLGRSDFVCILYTKTFQRET